MELGIERIREAAPHLDEIGYRVDDIVIDVRRQRVVRGDQKIPLSPLSYELLLALLHAAPNLVSLDELMKRVWPGLVVSPETVSQRVKLVRHALGDDATSPRYIAGVRGRGYRLVASVESVESAGAPGTNGAARPPSIGSADPPRQAAPHPETSASPSPVRRGRLLRWIVWTALGLVLAAVLVFGILHDQSLRERLSAQRTASVTELAGNSLAVLPFVNLSGDPASEYFSDGLSEEILNRLSRSQGLRVLARTSSFAYKGSGLDARKLQQRLGVRYLLEGSVRREGRHLRITAQLIDESGFRVWSDSYDREITGIFAIQDEIAASVATSILPQVVVARPGRKKTNPDVEAYEHYLVGREILRKRGQDADVLARQELERAVAIDPAFAEARAELAIALALSGNWKSVDAFDRAQEEVDSALSLNPDLARAHAAQGFLLLSRHVVLMQPLDSQRTEIALRTALELDPNMVDARNWLANMFAEQGRYEDARTEWERAARVAPLAPAVNTNLAADFASQGDFAEAERRLRRLLDVPQPSIMVWLDLAELYFSAGRLVRSNQLAKQLAWRDVRAGRVSNELLVTSYARLGLWEAAVYWQDRIERERGEASFAQDGRLELLRLQGRYTEAAALLERILESGQTGSAAAHLRLRLGALHAMAGDYESAIQALEPASLADFTPAELDIDAGQALAWSYLQTGTPEDARPILEGLEQFFLARRTANRLHESRMRYQFAQNAVLAGDSDLAIARLRQAVEAGWRDYYRLLHDPRWQPVSEDPRFRALVTTVKADVDRQRAEVEQIDRDDDFIARIDAAVARRERRN